MGKSTIKKIHMESDDRNEQIFKENTKNIKESIKMREKEKGLIDGSVKISGFGESDKRVSFQEKFDI